MRTSNMFRPYVNAFAAMMGIAKSIPLPFHRPYVVYEPNTGRRRTSKSRINRGAWKCNEINPRTSKKRGHLNDIVQTYPDNTALVQCRRCQHRSRVKIHWPEREAKAA